jgi:hypothetical protein
MCVCQGMSIECAIEISKDLGFLGCERMLTDQAQAGQTDVEEVQKGGVVVRGGGSHDVTCC